MDKKNKKFSIIVPVFNVEKYIKQCVESVLNQTYKNWELILIDDGSTDGTLDYLKTLKHNKKIKIIFSQHGGVSQARNKGLRKATGDYVLFLDSDDFIELWTLEYLNKKLLRKDIDAFVGMFHTTVEENVNKTCHSEKLQKTKINSRTHEELLEYFYSIRLIFTVWRFVVKREIILNNSIYFKKILYHEDEDWVTRLLLHIKNLTLIEEPFYNYRIRSNSIMTTDSFEFFKIKNDCRYKNACNFIEMAQNYDEQYIKDFLYRCAYKNVQQVYSDIKKRSHPYYPNKRGAR